LSLAPSTRYPTPRMWPMHYTPYT